MKRLITITLILFCSANLFAQTGGQLTGEITEFTGTVELKHPGSSDFVPARAGDTLSANTLVSTGFRSTAIIKAGSTVLTVRPLTRLTLAEISISSETEAVNVSLQTGRVRVDVNPPAGTRANFTVQGPSSTASVRGTSFEFDTISLTVLEGEVVFHGANGGTYLVYANSSSEVNQFGRAEDPVEIYWAQLFPAPPAGSNTGFINSNVTGAGNLGPGADFEIGFELR